MRRLYTLLLYLALPFVLPGLALRAWRQRASPAGWRERFGFGPGLRGGGIWIHAVSVGEVQAAAMLVGALQARYAALELTLSCATPTGRERARVLMPGIATRYAPYDLPGSVRRCLARLRPRLLIVIETELWPNLLHEAWRAGVPTLIASARISARSMARLRRLPGLLRPALEANVWVGAQTATDAVRFAALGVRPERLSVAGNIKFDRRLAPELVRRGAALRRRYAAARPLWVAGSTHAGEEAIVLEAHRQLCRSLPGALLVLAPRHPPRFDAAAATVAASGLRCLRRSADVQGPPGDTQGDAPGGAPGTAPGGAPDCDVLLLDTLGELVDFYAAADAAFVGGSLVPVGGHNLLEPAALGVPVLSGPQQFNSPDVARILAEHDALITIHDAAALAARLVPLLSDAQARSRQGERARAAVEANQGALERVLQLAGGLLR